MVPLMVIRSLAIAAFQAARADGLTIIKTCAKTGIPRSTYLKYREIFNSEPVDDIGTGEDVTDTR
ncbi:hypothetical protein IP70_13040 [alpha proteobacterium AAP38]|nr:hypothetical protein IP70_13040 [alpha proteobacterium AAP38]